uniref:Reverse transcriptase domain-containing protein n=1 Tax=Tanacetum cinerariifolium TaxID=118510 RepID=A0A6L2MD83_TANCI|nr:reverse transcriptase domain-containing protein [Tanacetum cinerariifolium]
MLEEYLEDHVLMLREKEQMITKLMKYLVVPCVMVFVAFKDNDVHTLFQMAKRYGYIDLFVAHKQQSSTPFKTRQKRRFLIAKKFIKVNKYKEVLRHTNKVVVTNYMRGFDNGKAIMIKDVEVVNNKRQVQPRPNVIVIREGGLMNVQADVGVLNNKQQVYPYGTIELSQPDGPNFKVNGHRLKHYFGEDIPKLVVPKGTCNLTHLERIEEIEKV